MVPLEFAFRPHLRTPDRMSAGRNEPPSMRCGPRGRGMQVRAFLLLSTHRATDAGCRPHYSRHDFATANYCYPPRRPVRRSRFRFPPECLKVMELMPFRPFWQRLYPQNAPSPTGRGQLRGYLNSPASKASAYVPGHSCCPLVE